MALGRMEPRKAPALRRSVFWRQFLKNRLAVAGGIVVVLLAAVALLAPALALYDPAAYDVKQILLAPSTSHWFGTENGSR